MQKIQDLTGKRFGRLVALEVVSFKPTKWKCQCDCGNFNNVTTMNLNSGSVRSCGCLSKELYRLNSRTHGKSNSKEYLAWCYVKQRCYYEKHSAYKYYGGRGYRNE